jgi:phage replication-related protein YjqB (UPF0714/DUF867 family)
MRKPDKYRNFAELKRGAPHGAYIIRPRPRPSKVIVIAPHGGRIEPGTSEIAARIAGDTYNLYRFEGQKPPGQNRDLHITSHRFHEPKALELVKKSSIVLGIHGCDGIRKIYVGGLDIQLRQDLAAALKPTRLRITDDGRKFAATHPLNICNLGARRCGAQLEISRDLRRSPVWRKLIAKIARRVIEQHVTRLDSEGAVGPAPLNSSAPRGT